MDITLIQIKKGSNEELSLFKKEIINYLATKKYSSKSITLLSALKLINDELDTRQEAKKPVKSFNKYINIRFSKDTDTIQISKYFNKSKIINNSDLNLVDKESLISLDTDMSLSITRHHSNYEKYKIPDLFQEIPKYLGKKIKKSNDDLDLLKSFDTSFKNNNNNNNVFDNLNENIYIIKYPLPSTDIKKISESKTENSSTICESSKNSVLNNACVNKQHTYTIVKNKEENLLNDKDLKTVDNVIIENFNTNSSINSNNKKEQNSIKNKELEIFLCSVNIDESESFFNL